MTVKRCALGAWDFVRKLYAEFNKDLGPMVSASMSFYALLSLVPLLLVAVAVVAQVLHSTETAAYSKVFEYVGRFSPSLAGDPLKSVVRGRGIAGGLGLLALLWSGTQFFVSLETAVNIAWNVRERRSFVKQRLVALGMALGAGALLLVNLGVTTLTEVVRGFHRIRILNVILQAQWTWTAAGFLITLALTTAMFTMVYKFLPNRHVKWRDALVGAGVAAVLWELAKDAFSWYVPRFAGYNRVYGSLGGVIILMVWIYYSSMVTVIGAEVSALRAQIRQRS
ncbi:MAG: YihY/virulence factor BrkB family protein [Armatimonadota bacterium]|nr:YihY/virulence factor BrkB family protein [Armatimonadota bacterium]